jgi:predicted transposase/invertase (TIGR01784 family)
MAKKNKTENESIFTGPARYINPYTDFGFHKLFGMKANKFILKDFLQVLLHLKGEISNLKYLKSNSGLVYDIYCETTNGEKFIVEMQRADQNYFIKKSAFYSSFPIASQKKKDTKWDYKFDSVYAIGVLDFVFDEDEKNKKYQYTHNFISSDEEVFYDKLTYVYLALPKFTKKIDELETQMDKWMYVLQNLVSLNKRPPELCEQIFQKLFRIAELKKLNPDEEFAYRQSQKRLWDMNNVLNTAYERGRERAHKEMMAVIEKDKIISEKEKLISEKEKLISEKEKLIEEIDKNLEELNNTIEKKRAEREKDWEKKRAEREKERTEEIAELKRLINEKLT